MGFRYSIAGTLIAAGTLAFSDASAQRSILPPVLGGGNSAPQQGQPLSPPPQQDRNFGGREPAPGFGTLGTLPSGPNSGFDLRGLENPGGTLQAPPPNAAPAPGVAGQRNLGTLPGSAIPARANDGALAAQFGRIGGPMPTPGLQLALRELLVDRSFQGLGGEDGRARAEALYRLGFIEDSTGAAVDLGGSSVAWRAGTARMLLAISREGQACEVAEISELPKGAEPGPTFELLEILAFCKLEQGDRKSAGLFASVVNDQGGGDALYQGLMKGAISGKAPRVNIGRARTFRPVHLALYARVGQPVPEALVARADLAVLVGLARRAADPGVAIAATERLVAAGLLPFVELDARYGDIAAPNISPGDALTKKLTDTALGRAQALRLAERIGGGEAGLALAIAAYDGARADNAGPAAAEMFAEAAASVPPSAEFARYAEGAARLLLAADRPDLAAGWIAAGEFADDPKARLGPFAAHRLKAIAAVLAPNAGYGLGTGALGEDVASVKLSRGDRAFIAEEAALLAALGDYVPPVLAELGGGQPAPWAPGAIGPLEAIGALGGLGGKDLGKIDRGAVLGAIAALRGLGLDGEARRLAADRLAAKF